MPHRSSSDADVPFGRSDDDADAAADRSTDDPGEDSTPDLPPSDHAAPVDGDTQSRVWDAALLELQKHGKFKRGDLDVDIPGSSIRNTLARMEHLEWLRREAPYSKTWRLGPKAARVLDVSEDTIDQSKE